MNNAREIKLHHYQNSEKLHVRYGRASTNRMSDNREPRNIVLRS